MSLIDVEAVRSDDVEAICIDGRMESSTPGIEIAHIVATNASPAVHTKDQSATPREVTDVVAIPNAEV